MNKALYSQKGFRSTLLTSLLIIAIAIATEYFEALFVHETGDIKIFGGIGIVLALGLIFKWRYVKAILSIFSFMALVGSIFMVSGASEEYLIPLSILLAAIALINYFLVFSKSVETYTSRK